MRNRRDITVINSRHDTESAAPINGSSGESETRPRLVAPSMTETAFAEFEDGTVVEMIEDPKNPSRTVFAVRRHGEISLTEHFNRGKQVLVPIPRNQNIVRHVRFPAGVKRYESVDRLLRQTYSILDQCLDLDDESKILLAFFVLSTWCIDQLPVAAYLALVGLPGSGKSTTLEALRLLCRRALLTADITSAAFYRACEELTPTLLLDETGTAGERRALFHLLRTGTTREVTAIRKNASFNTFGPKVISWVELPDDAALNSRCIVIPLRETHRTDLRKPSSPEIVQAADDLQKQLLQFRLETYKKLSLPRIQGDEKLHSRTRDLYEALALPTGERVKNCQWLVENFTAQQESNREPLPEGQAAVLQLLFFIIHQMPPGYTALVRDLTSVVNSLLQRAGEFRRLSPREVGGALSSLGFTKRKRTNVGYEMRFDLETRKRIHELVSRYGIDNTAGVPKKEALERCEFCRKLDMRRVVLERERCEHRERGKRSHPPFG